jgi:sugar lactone lactonase YvrE
VYEIEAGTGGNAAGAVSSASTVVTVGSGFTSPKGTAVDASGHVFVADSGNNAVKEIEAGTGGNAPGVVSSASTVVTVASGFDAPQGIAFDGIGDLFVADSGNSVVKEIEARTGRGLGPVSSASTVVTVGSGFSGPQGVAVDGAGNVFVADSGNNAVKEIEAGTGGNVAWAVSSASTVVTVGSGFEAPQGIAVDGAGDVFVADSSNSMVKEIVLTTPPALSFASTEVGSTSSDSPQTVVVQNAGNAGLAFSSIALGGNANFPLFGTTTCSTSTALDQSGLCTVAADFSPVQPGAQSATITLTDNSLNVSGSAQAISLSGLATAATGTTAQTITFPQPLTPAQTNTTAGLTASASSGLRVIYSVVSGPATVSGSTVTYTGVGTVVLEADQYGNGTYAAASPVQVTVAVAMTGSVGTASTATVTIAAAGTVGAISVLTQGATGKDFQYASGGTCAVGTTYAAGSTCTVEYTFTPTRPGQRQGAIVLESNASPAAPLGTALLAATGTGPLATFPGSTALSTVSSGYTPRGVAVDGAGDVFVADYYNQVVKKIEAGTGGNAPGVVSASSTVVTVGSGFSYPDGGLAVDGAGDVFVADSGTVYEIEAGTGGNAAGVVSSSSTVVTVGSGFDFPHAVAVDGAGNVFVPDTGTDALYEIEAGTGGNAPGAVSSSSTVVTLRTGIDSFAVAVDGAGDVFLLDVLASVVNEIEAGTGGNAPGVVSSSSTMVTVGSGFYYPWGLALDGAGDVFVADWGNNAVKEIEAGTGGNAPGVVSSSSTVVTLGSGLSGATALAVDGAGNVFITDTAVEQLVLTTPPSLSFASTAVGSTSSDSPQTVVVQNAGNASLSFPVPGFGSNPSLSANFTLGSASTCPQVTSSSGSAGTLASSGLCTEVLSFTPTMAGSVTGSLVLTDDSLNPGTTTTQTINLSGTATPATATVTVQPATIVYGSTPTTLMASISYAGTIAPIGAVTFTVDSGTAVTASCTGSSSPLTCTASYATGSLGAGTHTITVSMAADTNYSAASDTAALTVTAATLTLTANNAMRPYGAANPALTGSVSGAAYSDSFTESFATSANATSAPGAYAIVPSVTGANVGDYSVSATSGTLTVTQAASVTTVSASAVSVNPNQSVTLTATVASTTTGTPTGSVTFYDNGTSLQQVSLNNGSASLTTLLGAGSTHTITVTYSGDTDFLGGSASATSTVSVTALDFTFSGTPATSSETVLPGSAAAYTFNIAPPYGSYGGPVTFTITGLPAGATASFSPAVIAANAGPQSITLTVQTAQPLARNDRQSPFRKELPLTALLLLPLMSSCKLRRRWNSRLLMLALLVAGLGGSTLLSGCGAEPSGQPASYTLTVTATSGQEQHSQTVTLIVQ